MTVRPVPGLPDPQRTTNERRPGLSRTSATPHTMQNADSGSVNVWTGKSYRLQQEAYRKVDATATPAGVTIYMGRGSDRAPSIRDGTGIRLRESSPVIHLTGRSEGSHSHGQELGPACRHRVNTTCLTSVPSTHDLPNHVSTNTRVPGKHSCVWASRPGSSLGRATGRRL